MEFKGTKGEWEYFNNKYYWEVKVKNEGLIKDIDLMNISCHLMSSHNGEVFSVSKSSECKANAKLIAAAPDLLEALQELIQVKEWKDSHGKDEHYLTAQPNAWKNAANAITKALQ